MKARRLLAKLAIWALILCMFTGTAYAIYQKTISLSGTVTLVFVAPTEPVLDADDYIKMARDAFNNSIPLYEQVRILAQNNVHPMTYGTNNESFYDAMHTVDRFFDGTANDHLQEDPVFMAQYSVVLSQLSEWYQEADAYHNAMYKIADAMQDWNRVGVYKQAAEDAYNAYIHAASWNIDPQVQFEKLKTNALSARDGYNQNVEDKEDVDAKVVDLTNKLAQAWELVNALQNYDPANGASQFATASPSPSPLTTPTLEPTCTAAQPLVDTPSPEPVPSPTLEPTSTATQALADTPSPEPVPTPTLEPTSTAMQALADTPPPESAVPTPTLEPTSTAAQTPEDTPSPEPVPAPTLPEPATPVSTPEPTSAASQDPALAPVLESAATQEETHKPESTSTLRPMPAPEPTPMPEQAPTPEPTQTPKPTPAPKPTPTPEPTLTPEATDSKGNGEDNSDAQASVDGQGDEEPTKATTPSIQGAGAAETHQPSDSDQEEKVTKKPDKQAESDTQSGLEAETSEATGGIGQ